MGHKEHGGTWHMEAAQLDTQRKKGEVHLEDQLDRPLDQPVEFLNSTGQASTRSSWGVKIRWERSLLSSISLSKLFQPACLSKKLGATTHSPLSSTTARRHLKDIKELFEKAKVQPTFKTLYKIEDPGQFSIPCQVNGHYFDRTLCDSGSCINLMPTQTAKLLGITRLQPAQISIGLANHTIAKPRGVVVDVLLEIGDIKIPVDFHVINIQGGCDTPLILGRPFLATAGAVMDLPNRRMSLANVDKTVFYKTIPFIAPNKLSYLITAQGRPREPPDHTQGHNETRTKRLCLRPCPYPISN
ncbi:unnamed protein product [Microthlaspi erraticum]|uniref:Aspartic peptidase DDI1-type domain-containing protein n=1 Tax=Microthlaspi erraticum TaxID=1685480 RepID=A0A6D2J322_9BRAS|nr:unnamed protein product [Microthlaspi erraticum]